MSETTGRESLFHAERLCLTCGKVHVERQRTTNPSQGYTWADPIDGHPYKSESWEDVAQRIAALAWSAVAANYDTSGDSIAEKQPLWEALADLEMALRKVGYGD